MELSVNLDLNTIVWLCGALLALASFVKLSIARTKELRSKLTSWLTEELTSIQKRKSLFEAVRKKRHALQLQREKEMRSAEEEIKKLNIAEAMQQNQSSKAA
jgi:hypothetical protein